MRLQHEIVPVELVDSIAGLKRGGTYKCVRVLLKNKLVHHDNSKYDGYRLSPLGYDYLAMNTLAKRGRICGIGAQIGVGKESDIFEVCSSTDSASALRQCLTSVPTTTQVIDEEGNVLALKLHRLGRTSFRAVKSKRDYLKHRKNFNWLYLSRLAALKEYAFMKVI